MPRKANYAEKINALNAKIEKKQSELKKLKEQLNEYKEAQEKENSKELLTMMAENGISADQAVNALKNAFNVQG